MGDKEIWDNDGNFRGTIKDSSSGYTSGPLLEKWQWVLVAIASVIGGLVGFDQGGLGGAIVGSILGPIVGAWMCIVVGQILPWAIGIFILSGLVWLIRVLWDVGK